MAKLKTLTISSTDEDIQPLDLHIHWKGKGPRLLWAKPCPRCLRWDMEVDGLCHFCGWKSSPNRGREAYEHLQFH